MFVDDDYCDCWVEFFVYVEFFGDGVVFVGGFVFGCMYWVDFVVVVVVDFGGNCDGWCVDDGW